MDEQEAKDWLAGIWEWSTQGYSVQEIEKFFREEGLVFENKRRWREFLELVNKAQEYTRCLRYRGNLKRACVGEEVLVRK